MYLYHQHCRAWIVLIASLLAYSITTVIASPQPPEESAAAESKNMLRFQKQQEQNVERRRKLPGHGSCQNTQEFKVLVPVVLEGMPNNVKDSEKEAMAISFRDTYNLYTNNLCDPLFRTAKSAALEIYPNGRANVNRRTARHLQPGLFQSFNGEYTVIATQSNCNVTVPCDNTLFSSSFGRRRLLGISASPPTTINDRDAAAVRDLAAPWFSVTDLGQCVCPPGEKWKEPDLETFQSNWYNDAIQELVDAGTVENIASQTIGESLICRCGAAAAAAAGGGGKVKGDDAAKKSSSSDYAQDENGIYVIPHNQYPCRCQDQKEFFGNHGKRNRRRRLKTGTGGKGVDAVQAQGDDKNSDKNSDNDTDSTCRAKKSRGTFLCPPFSRS
jgi:hypothetical protein